MSIPMSISIASSSPWGSAFAMEARRKAAANAAWEALCHMRGELLYYYGRENPKRKGKVYLFDARQTGVKCEQERRLGDQANSQLHLSQDGRRNLYGGSWDADGRGYHLAEGSTWEYVGGTDRSVGLKYGSNGRLWKGREGRKYKYKNGRRIQGNPADQRWTIQVGKETRRKAEDRDCQRGSRETFYLIITHDLIFSFSIRALWSQLSFLRSWRG